MSWTIDYSSTMQKELIGNQFLDYLIVPAILKTGFKDVLASIGASAIESTEWIISHLFNIKHIYLLTNQDKQ